MHRGGRGVGATNSNVNRGSGGDSQPIPPMSESPEGSKECFICAEPVRAFCVFPCGHYTCYSCGLRIHAVNEGGCPVCRLKSGDPPVITRAISQDDEQYSTEEMNGMRALAIADRKLKCVIDGAELAREVAKLYEFLCPLQQCWHQGQQDPFFEFASLRDHLRIDHKLAYCEICVENRSAFLCEQTVYGEEALVQHLSGVCPHDSASFTGHPPCKFCSKRDSAVRFYDGEALLSHMQQNHFTCDVCNKGQYTFTFYDNRNKLNQHFERCHKICDHPDCQSLDLLVRVFANDFDLAVHRQRVHGMKVKLVLNQSSFASGGTDGGAGNVHADGGAGGGSSSGGAPATGSNTNVIQITFDHIFRRETVEMLPTKASTSGRQHNRAQKHGGNGNSAKLQVFAPKENGLPQHFHRGTIMDILICTGAAGTAPHHVDPASPNDPGATHAFGISESLESYNVKNKVPTDPREQERLLNELLARELTSPVAYAYFRSYTKEFIDSKLLTSQYYDLLSKEIFPDKNTFSEVFPLLVATVPNPSKKMALQEVWKMRMAPERQRLSRAQEEDARAREAEEERAKQAALWEELKSGKVNSAKSKNARNAGKQNAWLNPGKVSTLQSSSSPTSRAPGGGGSGGLRSGGSSPSPQLQGGTAAATVATTSPNQWATSSLSGTGPNTDYPAVGSVWGSNSGSGNGSGGGNGGATQVTHSSPSPASPSAARASGLDVDEMFPALPNNSVRGGGSNAWGQKKKPAPKRPNAWFQK